MTSAIGGPAATVYPITSHQGVVGRDAVRAEIVTDGRAAVGGPQQAVYYVSDAEIAAGEFSISGNPAIPIVEVGAAGAVYPAIAVYADGRPVSPTPPEPVLPQVASATLLLDLRASQLSLSDGDPVSTWPDASGNGRDFTQTGDARPIYKSNVEDSPAVYFDGLDTLMWMVGDNFADNLDTFAVVSLAKQPAAINDSTLISKLDNDTDYKGWYLGVSFVVVQNDTDLIWVENDNTEVGRQVFKVRTGEFVSPSTAHVYVNGDNSGESAVSSGTISSYSTSEPVRLGLIGSGIGSFTGLTGWIRGVLVYQITDLTIWQSTDRAAIEAWLATNP